MRFGGATEAGRMQRPTSDDNRRGVTRGGEAPKALTAENDVELALAAVPPVMGPTSNLWPPISGR